MDERGFGRGGVSEGYRPTRRSLEVVEDLCRDELGLAEVASRHGMTLMQLARWAGRTGNVWLLEALAELTARRSMLLAARARADAALALRRLAVDRKNPETARKACVDLLRMEVDASRVVRAASAEGGEREAGESDEAALLGLLERLARVDREASGGGDAAERG